MAMVPSGRLPLTVLPIHFRYFFETFSNVALFTHYLTNFLGEAFILYCTDKAGSWSLCWPLESAFRQVETKVLANSACSGGCPELSTFNYWGIKFQDFSLTCRSRSDKYWGVLTKFSLQKSDCSTCRIYAIILLLTNKLWWWLVTLRDFGNSCWVNNTSLRKYCSMKTRRRQRQAVVKSDNGEPSDLPA